MQDPDDAVNRDDMQREPEEKGTDNAGDAREAIIDLCGAHSGAIIQHGTRLLVAGELLNSITRHLPRQIRSDIADTFRKRIERLLALGDDSGLPSEYMGELVSEVNKYLRVLDSE